MARMNSTTKGHSRSQYTTATRNRAGGKAFTLTEQKRYLFALLTSFFSEPKFYGDNTLQLVKDMQMFAEKDSVFFMNSLVYARNVMNLRSVAVAGLAVAVASNNSKPLVATYAPMILKRPDELAEVIAMFNSMFVKHKGGLVVPNQLRKAISNALVNFDEYQLAKYKGEGRDVSLVDVLNLAHPTPINSEHNELFARVVNNSLATPFTWETQISGRGSTKETWEEVVLSGRMGIFAIVRNLRNLLKVGVNHATVDQVVATLTNPKIVCNSRMLPFRFYAAYRELSNYNIGAQDPFVKKEFLGALEKAISLAAPNLQLDGRTAVLFDGSGSMTQAVSGKSSMHCYEICNILGSILMKELDGVAVKFGCVAQILIPDPSSGILSIAADMHRVNVGYSTNAHEAVEALTQRGIKVDRMIILSDMQVWNSNDYWSNCGPEFRTALKRYQKRVTPDVKIHSVDLAGYGTSPFMETDEVNMITGWSDRIFEFIRYAEQGVNTLVKVISDLPLERFAPQCPKAYLTKNK